MAYVLGKRSKAQLVGVHPKLVSVVELAITLTEQDFVVQEGLRSLATQKKYVAQGVSKTLNSKHRVQADGFGHAVDLVPYIGGQPRWEWIPIWKIADAVDRAATQLNVPLVWGAVWGKSMMTYGGSPELLKKAVDAYTAQRRAQGKSAFLDGPHFQLI